MIYADPPDWEDSPGQYEYTAYVVAVVFYEDEQMVDEGDLFAAFDGDGNVRGLSIGVFVPLVLMKIQLYGNLHLGVMSKRVMF